MKLMKYLPSFYYHSGEVGQIQSSIEIENDKLQSAIKDLLDQLFIEHATWGLDDWENYLGLVVDPKEPLESRRSRLMTRLRGQGTTTKTMLKNVCRSFTGGEVEIIEKSKDYSFIIKFIDVVGVPSNINYLKQSIEEIKPAHLDFTFEYKYNTYNVAKNFTHNALASFTHKGIREEELINA